MAYKALYRTYRPQTFDEVVGQQHIIKTLQNAIKLNKVAHAYLFCGPRGTGKTTLAKIMAKALNCENGPTINPCCKCKTCQSITQGTLNDVVEIDAASNNGVDDVRTLRETVKYLPSDGRYKIYIIDEVHMLSTQAFNALLKTLEEPPSYVIFILATTEPYKLLPTILSRCQRFDFRSLTFKELCSRISEVSTKEGIKITQDAVEEIATSAEGGMRDALSLLDQVISSSVNEEINIEDVLNINGNVGYKDITVLLNYALEKDQTNTIVTLNNILKEGKEIPKISDDIISFLRDVLIFKNNVILEEKNMYKDEEFIRFSNKISENLIYSWLDIINEALNSMRVSNEKRIYLELALIKMSNSKKQQEVDVLNKIEALENTLSSLQMIINKMSSSSNSNINNINYQNTNSFIMPSDEAVDNYFQNQNKNPRKPIVFKEENISIQEIEEILNNANKEKREKILKIWNNIGNNYNQIFSVQIFINGKLVAVSDSAIIVALKDTGFCNRVMQYENYVKIIDILNDNDINVDSFICLPEDIWCKIRADYLSKYKQGILKPHLNNITIDVKRRRTISEEKPLKIEEKVLEYIDKDKLKIVED